MGNLGKLVVANQPTEESAVRKAIVFCGVALAAVTLLPSATVAKAPDSLDLYAFAPFDTQAEVRDDSDPFVIVSADVAFTPLPPVTSIAREISDRPARQFYVSSIIGGSFLVVSADNSPSSILTAGGALGAALDRSDGRLRMENEVRYRDPIEQTYIGFNRTPPRIGPGPQGPTPPIRNSSARCKPRPLAGGRRWPTLWHDLQLTEQLDAYGGGGIGAAGFNTSFQQIDTVGPARLRLNIARSMLGNSALVES